MVKFRDSVVKRVRGHTCTCYLWINNKRIICEFRSSKTHDFQNRSDVYSFIKAMRARESIISKLGQYLEKTIRKRESQDSVNPFLSALELLAEGESKIGTETKKPELLEAALELLFAGHETSSSAACATMLHLANKVRNNTYWKLFFTFHFTPLIKYAFIDRIHRIHRQ